MQNWTFEFLKAQTFHSASPTVRRALELLSSRVRDTQWVNNTKRDVTAEYQSKISTESGCSVDCGEFLAVSGQNAIEPILEAILESIPTELRPFTVVHLQ